MNTNKESAEQILAVMQSISPFGKAGFTAEGMDIMERGTRITQLVCYKRAEHSGWWKEYEAMPEQYRKHFIAGKLMLCVSELAESMEGFRKNLQDDHLPHRKMIEVELADAIIRINDLSGALNLDIAGALIEKLAYNQHRPDHKPEARAADKGKSF